MPEFKREVTKLEDLTCKDCIYSDWVGDSSGVESLQCHKLGSNYLTITCHGQFCSEGQWLFRYGTEPEPVPGVYRFSTIYEILYYQNLCIKEDQQS